jgi:protein TonB
MNKNLILKTDILDIIFEKRNKAYGAYDLRKFYPDRLKLALGLMFLLTIFFSAFTFMPKKTNRISGRVYDIPQPGLTKAKEPVKEPEKKPEVKQPDAKQKTPVNQKILTNQILIVPKNTKTDSVVTILTEYLIGTKTILVDKPGVPFVEPPKTEPGTGVSGKSTPKINVTVPMDLDAVDVPPSYPGGMDAFRKFMEKNLHTPDELESGEIVTVRVRFVVDYTGKLQSFVPVLDGGEVYNKEVMRVLKKMPDWIPGKAKGENVPVYYVIPVKFVTTD